MLLAQGLDAIGSSQEDFAKMVADETAKWAKAVRAVGLQPN
jgi:hypothetical protein